MKKFIVICILFLTVSQFSYPLASQAATEQLSIPSQDNLVVFNEEETNMLPITEIGTYAAEDPGSGSIWTYSSTSYGSSKAAQYTTSAIALTVASISKVPQTATWVANMAALYYSFGKDIVYYKYVYYKSGSGITQKTLTMRYLYTDSARTNMAGYSSTVCDRTGCTTKW